MTAARSNIAKDGSAIPTGGAGQAGDPGRIGKEPGAAVARGAAVPIGCEVLTGGSVSDLTEAVADQICDLLTVEEPQRLLVLCGAPEDRPSLQLALLQRSVATGALAPALPELLTVEEFCSELLLARASVEGLEPPQRISDAARISLPTDAFGAGAGRSIGAAEQRARLRTLAADLAGIDMIKQSGLQAQGLSAVLAQPDCRLSDQAHRLGRSMLAYEDALRLHNLIDGRDLLRQGCAAVAQSGELRRRLSVRYSMLIVLLAQPPSPVLCTMLAELSAAIGGSQIAGCPSAGLLMRALLPGARESIRSAGPGAGAVGRAHKPDLNFCELPDGRRQSQFIAEQVAALATTATQSSTCRIHVAMRSLRNEGPMIAAALKQRAIPFRVIRAPAPMQSAAARDLLAWMAFIADAQTSAPAMRLLSRAPWALRDGELARVAQIVRRHGTDALAALQAAQDTPQLQGHARERVAKLLALRADLVGLAEASSLTRLLSAVIDRGRLQEEGNLLDAGSARAAAAELDAIESLAHELMQLWPERSAIELAELLARAGADGIAEAQRPQPADEAIASEVLLRPLEGGQIACEHLFVCGGTESVALALPDEARGLLAIGQSAIFSAADELMAAVDGSEQVGSDAWPPAAQDALDHLISGVQLSVTFANAQSDESGSRMRAWPVVEALRADCGRDWISGAELDASMPAVADRRVLLRVAAGRAQRRLMEEADRIGARLGELKLDSDFDLAGGVVALFELVKLKALGARAQDQDPAELLEDLNGRLHGAATPLQQELLAASQLDSELLRALTDEGDRAIIEQNAPSAEQRSALAPFGSADELSLGSLVPRHGNGVAMSATDLWLYETCPLRYRYARLLRIPAEFTSQQRFGIAVHQALERFHQHFAGDPQAEQGAEAASLLLRLLDNAWRRSGFGDGGSDREWLVRAREALRTYHQRLSERRGRTAWVERPFSFTVGDHRIRGRIDRVDLLADGTYELIDYKTGRARSPEQLAGDVQLSLYSLAARQAWNLTASSLDYYYVLDDVVVSVAQEDELERHRRVSDQVRAVGEGILALRFPAQPSFSACSNCDFLGICPAAES